MYKLYKDLLNDIDEIEFIETNSEDTSPWFIDILVDKGLRDKLASFLNEKGIGTEPFYPPIHTQPPYLHVKGSFKNSDYISQRGVAASFIFFS